MSVSIIRREFERARIQGTSVEDCVSMYGCELERKQRWEERLLFNLDAEDPPILHEGGRRLNNFCIGSDPEFVFTSKGSNHKMNGSDLGLKPGLAAGSDQNLRLIELRGWPSTSVIEHVAGLLSSLRWMYRLYPNVRNYGWRAGAWYDGDGIGGHVHFGRKRTSRPEEILGLDGLAKVFRILGIFNNAEWDKRSAGDARGQRYGSYGDFRVQLHGYEYRCLPSWLSSPAQAFLCIAASKLVIFDPEMTMNWGSQQLDPLKAVDRLKRLAQYYCGQDDDAWILKHLLARKGGMEQAFLFHPDFKKFWGFDPLKDLTKKVESSIMPACIAPEKSDCKEILDNIVEGKALTFVEKSPTFKNTLPPDYFWMYQNSPRNVGRGGVGDLMTNLVGHQSSPIQLIFSDDFSISRDLIATWTPEDFAKAKCLIPRFRTTMSAEYPRSIWISREMTLVGGIKQTREFLLRSGLFPLWTVDSVKETSIREWLTSRKKVIKVVKSVPEERVL